MGGKATRLDHVMTPVVKIINGICSKAKQIRTFMLLLEELSSAYGDLSLHTEMWWLSRGQVLQRFLSRVYTIKGGRLLDSRGHWVDTWPWIMDKTKKLDHLNCELQGKGKSVADKISAVNTVKQWSWTYSLCSYREKKCCTFPWCSQCWMTMLVHLGLWTKLQQSTIKS